MFVRFTQRCIKKIYRYIDHSLAQTDELDIQLQESIANKDVKVGIRLNYDSMVYICKPFKNLRKFRIQPSTFRTH
jgi:hypothetical protein